MSIERSPLISIFPAAAIEPSLTRTVSPAKIVRFSVVASSLPIKVKLLLADSSAFFPLSKGSLSRVDKFWLPVCPTITKSPLFALIPEPVSSTVPSPCTWIPVAWLAAPPANKLGILVGDILAEEIGIEGLFNWISRLSKWPGWLMRSMLLSLLSGAAEAINSLSTTEPGATAAIAILPPESLPEFRTVPPNIVRSCPGVTARFPKLTIVCSRGEPFSSAGFSIYKLLVGLKINLLGVPTKLLQLLS